MAQRSDDDAALIRHLSIEQADVFGYSIGGGVALQVAVRHPEVVRKLVTASASGDRVSRGRMGGARAGINDVA